MEKEGVDVVLVVDHVVIVVVIVVICCCCDYYVHGEIYGGLRWVAESKMLVVLLFLWSCILCGCCVDIVMC